MGYELPERFREPGEEIGKFRLGTGHYILDENGNPKPVDLMEWAGWFDDPKKRIVKQTDLHDLGRVSTIFLGLDHSFAFGEINPLTYKPVLWETMIFGGVMDDYQDRYTSREAAIEDHDRLVAELKRKGRLNWKYIVGLIKVVWEKTGGQRWWRNREMRKFPILMQKQVQTAVQSKPTKPSDRMKAAAQRYIQRAKEFKGRLFRDEE